MSVLKEIRKPLETIDEIIAKLKSGGYTGMVIYAVKESAVFPQGARCDFIGHNLTPVGCRVILGGIDQTVGTLMQYASENVQ